MRLLALRLVAYGPFTEVEIDLARPGLHVIYGDNEAGKSTTLRAITGLLFGIARNTPDTHTHKGPELRIGGMLADEAGQRLEILRRKGKDHTLLDKDKRPIDPALMTRMLGGLGESQFLTMFGLDHETLRKGGAALLLDQGHAGESLFGAAMAGGALNAVLRALRAEADELFTPKAHVRPLNEAIKAYHEAHKRARALSMSPDSVQEQVRALEELRAERVACEAERRRVQIERSRLERASRALPLLAKKKALAEKQAALADVVRLAPDARAVRIEQQRIIAEADLEIARLSEKLRDLDARRETLIVPESLVAFAELPLGLASRLASHRKDAADRVRLEAEIEELEAGARDAQRALGRTQKPGDADALRIDAKVQSHVHALALELASLGDARQRTRRAMAEARARLSLLEIRNAELPPPGDLAGLKKALQRAERDGPLEARAVDLAARASSLEQALESLVASLGLAPRSPRASSCLPLPSLETVERHVRRFSTLEHEGEKLAAQQREHDERAARFAREMKALELAGKVPSESELAVRRRERDDAWSELRSRASLPGASVPGELLQRFEERMRVADAVSDVLCKEADRVSRLAALHTDVEALSLEQIAARDKQADFAARTARADAEWRDLFRAAGIDPLPPLEARAWLVRHATLTHQVDELAKIEADAKAVDDKIAQHQAALIRELERHGERLLGSATYDALVDRTHEVCERLERLAAEKQQVEQSVFSLRSDLEASTAQDRAEEAQEAALREKWRDAVALLGLLPDASPSEAEVTMERLSEACQKLDRAASARRRVAVIERDFRDFARDVELVSREHAPDLLQAPVESAAARIVERFQNGQMAAAERRQLDRQRAEVRELLATQRQRKDGAERMLRELMARARVNDPPALEAAEERAGEAARIDAELARADAELLEIGGTSDALAAELEGCDPDEVPARIAALEEEQREIEDRAVAVRTRISSYEAGLQKLDAPDDQAARAASEAEAHLAKVRDLSHRYIVARVASVVLAREIETYRKSNQGPIVARAGELFHKLTMGSFATLKVDFNEQDEPVLLGERADGRELGAAAMSDGARDQLFLALRIATLERYIEHHPPLPLVVDDILVHFDDDRAKAALLVLSELSARMQVLFFTHHRRLVELAQDAVLPDGLTVHRLESRRPPSFEAPSSPVSEAAMVSLKAETQ